MTDSALTCTTRARNFGKLQSANGNSQRGKVTPILDNQYLSIVFILSVAAQVWILVRGRLL